MNKIYELIKRADKNGLLNVGGWHRNFLDVYISGYEWKRFNTFTDEELEELKVFQKDMRKALDEIDKMRYERYSNGKATREDMVRLLDADILSNEKQWGYDYLYTKWAREHKKKALYAYDNHLEPVDVGKVDSCYRNGYDYETYLYTDGTLRTSMYAAY